SMSQDRFLFWTLALTTCVVCGWWLSVRPGAPARDVATPVSGLIVVIAALLCMLTFSGHDVNGYTIEIYHFMFGR
ncbi:MAG: hypothetical protein JNG88_10435, partial [Phycisphaerales bacterium]|nr:hypothetical protein [Phycisphaerales bacterium]